jgi:hypothetical protein
MLTFSALNNFLVKFKEHKIFSIQKNYKMVQKRLQQKAKKQRGPSGIFILSV